MAAGRAEYRTARRPCRWHYTRNPDLAVDAVQKQKLGEPPPGPDDAADNLQ